MGLTITHEHWVSICGVLGNIIAMGVYLASVPIVMKIYKHKSSQNYSAIPYSMMLFSAMITLYYGFNKHEHGLYLITINSFGILMGSFYLLIYLMFAPWKTRIYVMVLILVYNLFLFGMIVLFTMLFSHGRLREKIVGFLCTVSSISVFAAPLSDMRHAIVTKSVDSLPGGLSIVLTICALIWLIYGIVIKDIFIIIPNVAGLALGFVQMVLYIIYRRYTNRKTVVKIPELYTPGQSGRPLAAVPEDEDEAYHHNDLINTDVVVVEALPPPTSSAAAAAVMSTSPSPVATTIDNKISTSTRAVDNHSGIKRHVEKEEREITSMEWHAVAAAAPVEVVG